MAIERPPTSAYYGIAEYDRADYGVVLDERFLRPPGVIAVRTMRQPEARGLMTRVLPIRASRQQRMSSVTVARTRRDLRGET